MAPKKAANSDAGSPGDILNEQTGDSVNDRDTTESATTANAKGSSKKRKAPEAEKKPSKASRRSDRGASKPKASQTEMLNFLLSEKALDLRRSEEEAKDLESRGKNARNYSGSELSPFEELVCAVVLSRPISHRLGLRTIRTIFNDPYNFTSPKAIKAAPPEKRHQAMFDARTQHKDKTATQLGMLADSVIAHFASDENATSLEKARKDGKQDWDTERDLLQTNIKGLGKTGLDIFFRRVQWLWPEAYPFVDERTARGVEKLGLPKSAEGLAEVIDSNWDKLDTSKLPKGSKDQAKRRAFVIVCERATSADLEGKAEALLEAATTS